MEDFQDFGLTVIDGRIAAFQIAAHLVRRDRFVVQGSCIVLGATSTRRAYSCVRR
jgi:hypothetical protein